MSHLALSTGRSGFSVSMTPAHLRMARAFLGLSQDEFGAAAHVARATVHRYEAGREVGEAQVHLMSTALVALGVVLIPDGTLVDGKPVYSGIATANAPGRRGDGTSGRG